MEEAATIGSTAIEMANILPLLIAEGALLLLVFIALPIYAIWKAKTAADVVLKGLALPQGSVRSGVALTVWARSHIFSCFGRSSVSDLAPLYGNYRGIDWGRRDSD